MPSIPQSLLWISLVVLWLFVLVPMLISKRDAVRRTSDVALATRVLNSGTAARLRRRGPAAGHRSDPDWRPADEDLDDDRDDADETPTRAVVMFAAGTKAADAEPDYLDVDVVEDSEFSGPTEALPVAEAAPAEEAVEEHADEPAADAENDELTLDYEEPAAEADEYETDERDDRDTEDEYEYVDDSSGMEAPSEADLRIADSISASRRRRHESNTAAAVTARKYRFRARTLTVMAVLVLTSAIAAFTWSSTMWWVCASVGFVAALYLAYLRRQTRIEEQLRRRRAQRMARSRLGVENTADQEFDVTPSRLRRPGAAVLEIDDEDPEFEHLEEVAFARHFDLPRAAGQ
ncbi:MAG: hypothetical protein SW019_06275 [Actinomycetota bacterium]|nr:hypothetical protein [Actinomycetota bacterium]